MVAPHSTCHLQTQERLLEISLNFPFSLTHERDLVALSRCLLLCGVKSERGGRGERDEKAGKSEKGEERESKIGEGSLLVAYQ